MPRVRFTPEDISVEVKEGENLLRAAMAADVQVTASCGGDGTCGKCRMVVEKGDVHTSPSHKLSEESRSQGYVLGCRTQVTEDIDVRIPPESRPGSVPPRDDSLAPSTMLDCDEYEGSDMGVKIDPPLRRHTVMMNPPDISDNTSDGQRLVGALRREHGVRDVQLSLDTLRALPQVIRAGDWTVSTTVLAGSDGAHVLDLVPGGPVTPGFAVAVDIGTTTIEAQLLDLTDGKVVAQASEYNAQISHGEDVITRVIAASTDAGLAELHALVLKSVRDLTHQMLDSSGVPAEDVMAYVAAGNTIMTHLLLGLSPEHIRAKPYIPAASRFPWVSVHEFDLPGNEAAMLHCLPCPASYVGGDIVAGVMASRIPCTDKLTLFVDIGTNGEIVLGNRKWLVACSCSAGPAFEGGGVLHGMRAAAGAIEQVRIHPETLEPMFLTTGLEKPLGICGSGLIDTVAELFLAGVIGRDGKFDRDTGNRHIRHGEHGWEYVLAWEDETAIDRDIVLTEVDIENLIRAKAAIFAGISVLFESVDMEYSQIEQVLVAGAFGHYLDLDRVIALGLLPELDTDLFTFIGNGSLIGARMAAVSRSMLETAEKVAQRLTYLELSVNALFMENYVSAMFLPHTDLTLFPRSEHMLASRSAGA